MTVNPAVTVSVSPSSVKVQAGKSQKLNATVNNASNSSVTWVLNPQLGSIAADGTYTAPAQVASSQTVTVQAVSVADPTASSSSSVNAPAGERVADASDREPDRRADRPTDDNGFECNGSKCYLDVEPGCRLGFGRGPLYSAFFCDFATDRHGDCYQRRGSRQSSASMTVTLQPAVTVSVTPATVTLSQSQTQLLTASVSGTTNQGVTWSLSPNLGNFSTNGGTAV